MKNTYLGSIVEDNLEKLEELGYDISEEKKEDLINGFIKIANSMLTDDMDKIPNIEFNKIIKTDLGYNFTMSALGDNVLDYLEKNLKIKVENEERSTNTYNDIEDVYEKEIMNNNKDLLDNLKGNKKNLNLDTTTINKLKKTINSKKDIIDKFNKGELNELEQQILMELIK